MMAFKKVTSLILGLAFTQTCFAGPTVHIDGFLTAAGGVMDADQVYGQLINAAGTQVRANLGLSPVFYPLAPIHPEMFNYNSKPEYQQDSILALQGNVDFNEKFGMTVQMVAKGAKQWQIEAEWAFLSYRMNDNIRFKVGRMRQPLFMMSESLEVGYTYPWVRPPLEVYQILTESNSSGGAMEYRTSVWNQEFEALLTYSSIDDPFSNPLGPGFNLSGQIIRHRQTLLGKFIFGNENKKLHLSYSESAITIEPIGQLTRLAQIYGALFNPNAFSDWDVTGTKANFFSVGTIVDHSNWVVMGEWVKRTSNQAAITEQKGYFGTLGYRFGNFLPHFTYSNLKTTDKNRRSYSGTFGQFLNPIYSLLNQDQETYILGLRYDVMTGVDIKLQAENIKALHGTNGLFNINPGKAVNLYTLALDMVF